MRLLHLFACLFCFSFSNGFGQSVYEDAKALTELMRDDKDNAIKEDVWVEFVETKPLDHIFIDSKEYFSVIVPYTEVYIKCPIESDYIIFDLQEIDTLFLYGYTSRYEDTLLLSIPVHFNYLILKMEGSNKYSLAGFSPNGDKVFVNGYETNGKFILKSSTKKTYGDESEKYKFSSYEFRSNKISHNKFSNNKMVISNDKYGYYFFESLPIGDTMKLFLSDTCLFYLYMKPTSDSLCIVYSGDTAHIEGNSFYLYNQFDKITLTAPKYLWENEPPIVVIEKPSNTKKFNLALYPKYEYLPKYNVYNKDVNSLYLEPYDEERQGSIAMKTNRMSIAAFTYYVFMEKSSFNQINIYKDGLIVNSLPFKSRRIIFSFKKEKEVIDFKMDRYVVMNKKFNTVKSIFKIGDFKSIVLTNGMLLRDFNNDSESGLYDYRIEKHFDFFRFEQDAWVKYDSNKFFKDGLYKVLLNSDNFIYYDKFCTLHPVYKKNENEFADFILPINWNPFVDFSYEILIDKQKAIFFFEPSIIEDNHSIYLLQEDSLPSMLASHSHLKESDLQTPNLWGDISAKYQSNPFLAELLKNNLAQNSFEELPGVPNNTLGRKVAEIKAEHYPWQNVVFDNARLQTDQGVSQEEVLTSYRTPVTTASDNLQSASAQFEGESKKLKRGLSTADLAAGLSDFIVERAQEELNVTFLSRLREGLLHEHAEFGILFPETRKMLTEFKIVQYRTLLDFAKNAFIFDLRNLGINFPKLFNKLDKYKEIGNNPEVYNIFLLYDIANKVYEGIAIDTVLLHVHKRLDERRVNLGKSINERIAMKADSLKLDTLANILKDFRDSLKVFQRKQDDFLSAGTAWWRKLFPDDDSTAALQLRPEWKIDTNTRQLTLANRNLQGDPDYDYILKRLPFGLHQDFFANPPKKQETIGAGIDLSKTLLSPVVTADFANKIQGIEERLDSMDVLRRKMDMAEAERTLRLSSYISVFERLREIQTQRACLELALKSELKLDTISEFNYFTEHDRQSLIYLQKVLARPEEFQLFDWSSVNNFNANIIRAGLDTCIVCYPDKNKRFQAAVCNNLRVPLNPHHERIKLVAVKDSIEFYRTEMENAGVFLSKMATAIREQFRKIAKDTVKGFKIADNIDSVYYNYFLFSKEITGNVLAFDFRNLSAKMARILHIYHPGDTAALRQWEVYQSRPWSKQEADQKIGEYHAVRRGTMTVEHPAGNAFLDHYNQTLKFEGEPMDQVQERYLSQEIENVRASVAALDSISRQFHHRLLKLHQEHAGDLLKSLEQAESFSTLTQITLQWLYAFRDVPEKIDSVFIRDSTLQHVVKFEPAGKDHKPGDIKTAQYDREVGYDTIRVNERNIGPRRWLTPIKFNKMMEDTLLRRCFMGLLYQRLSAIEGGPRYDARSMALLATKFMNTIYDIDERRELLKHKKENNQSLRFEDYYPFIRSTVDMLNIVLETPFQTGGDPLVDRFETLRDVPKISNEVLSLFEHVFAENYPNAIRNVVQLLSITWGLDIKTEGQRPRAGAAATNGKEQKQSRLKLTREDKKNMKVKSAILLYGSFMANMVGAQTPDQVKAAIRAVAVPAGSSSIKRNSSFNISVNSYLGLGGYREFLTDITIPEAKRAAFTFGLSVPVGVAFSWANREAGFSRKFWKRCSYSLFFPVIDLGAVTAYRIDQKNVNAAMPELNFGNIIAPGAYFMLNFPRSPFTLGAGWQWGPQLRKITVDNNTEITSRAWRIGVTATIDVPIFNIFTSRE